MSEDNKRLDKLENTVDRLDGTVTNMRDNHLAHLKKDVVDVQLEVREIRTDVKWIKKYQWLIISASVGGLIAALIPLIVD